MLGTYGRSRNIEGIRSVRGHVHGWRVSPRGSDDRRASATQSPAPLECAAPIREVSHGDAGPSGAAPALLDSLTTALRAVGSPDCHRWKRGNIFARLATGTTGKVFRPQLNRDG